LGGEKNKHEKYREGGSSKLFLLDSGTPLVDIMWSNKKKAIYANGVPGEG